jgi:mono/diheme cytochrome c family protein
MKRRIALNLAFLLLVGGAAFAAGNAENGKAVFEKKCKVCHGPTGEGNPGMARALGATMKPLGSDEIQKKSDADVKKIITEGSGKMKPVKGLTDEEISDVIAFVRTLKK